VPQITLLKAGAYVSHVARDTFQNQETLHVPRVLQDSRVMGMAARVQVVRRDKSQAPVLRAQRVQLDISVIMGHALCVPQVKRAMARVGRAPPARPERSRTPKAPPVYRAPFHILLLRVQPLVQHAL
jgi:hypothetical protein